MRTAAQKYELSALTHREFAGLVVRIPSGCVAKIGIPGWVKEGVGLVVHFPLEDVSKINTPVTVS
jgi:hypothetical protein